MTNRKSHTCFRLVPKSTTLDDLALPRYYRGCEALNTVKVSRRRPQEKSWGGARRFTKPGIGYGHRKMAL